MRNRPETAEAENSSTTFKMTVGPCIPDEHADHDLLPHCRADGGGEVFSYPAELSAIEEMISEHEDEPDAKSHVARLMPYGKAGYAEYFDLLSAYEEKYRETDPGLSRAIERLIGAVKRMNVKEGWSVVRYVGAQYDGDPLPGLTKGRCYYWPCSREKPVYEGVIDNEEFTSYRYPRDPDSWEVVLDPTGMATCAFSGEADTVPG